MRPILLNGTLSLWALRELEVQLHFFWTLALDGCECSASHAGYFIPREGVCGTQKEVNAPEAVCAGCTREESTASARNQKQRLQCPSHSFATTSTTSSSLSIFSVHLTSNTLHNWCSKGIWHHTEWNMKTRRTLCDNRPHKPLVRKCLTLLNTGVP